jgi:hypothetical protein
MQQGLRKSEAYQWICQDFSQALDAQEIGAARVKKSLNLGYILFNPLHPEQYLSIPCFFEMLAYYIFQILCHNLG